MEKERQGRMAPTLELRLFGTARARYHGQALPGFPNQQPHLLLCYLLLNRNQPHPREQLAAIFWGDYPTRTSLKYLRNALWRLRQLLQSAGVPTSEYLAVGDQSVSFSCSGRYWLDVEAFEAMTVGLQGLKVSQLTPEQVGGLEEAIDLYSGDLLDGIYQDWCLYERERFHLLYLNTLGRLMAFHEINGTYERGLAYGRRVLACDSTRENVHRHMMRLYWLLGDRNAALAQYKRCGQILRETLNIAPMEATQRLYRQIVSGQPPTQDSPSSGAVSTSPGRHGEPMPSLVDQALQRLQHLQAVLDEANTELRHISRLIQEAQPPGQDVQTPVERRSQDAA
jgi:DNA-binding SARP family transcriptional activator